ncbi:MAG: hypothetical protein RLZZ522_94 [Verrucomicrobiota bacterium]
MEKVIGEGAEADTRGRVWSPPAPRPLFAATWQAARTIRDFGASAPQDPAEPQG